jgi:ABC-type sugar transport system substrate-binding protein
MQRPTGVVRAAILLIALGIVATAVAACGGGGSSTTSGSGGGATANSETTADSGSSCATEATKAINAARKTLEPEFPSEPVDSSKNAGKTIWFISSTQQVPTLVAISEGVEEAAAAAGMHVKIYDGAGSPSKYNEGLTQAVAQGADGIILQGIDPELVKAPLAKSQAAEIPTIDSMNGDPDEPLQNGISSHVTIDFTRSGELMADYILSKTNCEANVLELTSSLFIALKRKSEGFHKEMERLCPECKIDTQQVDFENISSSVNSLVRTGIQKEPNTNFVMGSDDGIAFYVVPALQGLGSDVPVVSGNGVPEDMEYVRKGENQIMDISFPPLNYIGWKQVDLLQRAMLGQKVPDGTLPQQVIDETNVTPDASEQFPGFDGFEKQYEELWGLG